MRGGGWALLWTMGIAVLPLAVACASSGQLPGDPPIHCTTRDDAYFAARLAEIQSTHTSSAASGRPVPIGPRSKESVAAAIGERATDIRRCYVRRSVQPSGEVIVRFAIAPGGHISRACVSETNFTTDAVPGCILEVMQQLRFPTISAETVVTYPFRFN